jgi:hypothetical protein
LLDKPLFKADAKVRHLVRKFQVAPHSESRSPYHKSMDKNLESMLRKNENKFIFDLKKSNKKSLIDIDKTYDSIMEMKEN